MASTGSLYREHAAEQKRKWNLEGFNFPTQANESLSDCTEQASSISSLFIFNDILKTKLPFFFHLGYDAYFLLKILYNLKHFHFKLIFIGL